jgi:hypothetical protein
MHFDQNIVFIIVAAVIGISRLIARITENAREQSQRDKARQARAKPQQPVAEMQPQGNEERIRQFLEALGQPKDAPPPPKVAPRTDIPPRTLIPVQPPPSMRPFARPTIEPWKEIKRRVIVLQQPTQREPQRPRAEPTLPAESDEPGAWMRQEEKVEAAAARLQAAAHSATTTATPGIESSVKQALHSPDSIRNAIILREILGSPRGFRDLDFA